METKQKILQGLIASGVIDTEDFYVISFSPFDIKCQGDLSSDKIKKYMKNFAIQPISDSGYVELTGSDGLKIVLT